MSPREGMYYVGMITGVIVGAWFARTVMGWPSIVGLLCGLAVGWPLGLLCERLYVRMMSKPKIDESGFGSVAGSQVACRNPNCQWSGDPGYSSICPRCGQELPRGR